MFTGLVAILGTVTRPAPARGGPLHVAFDPGADPLAVGESIAVNGACLTVTGMESGTVRFDVSPQTLATTTLGALSPGTSVHVERALAAQDRLGGHMVLGHVDGLGTVDEFRREGEGWNLWISMDPDVARVNVEKGSIAVDGISLTIAELRGTAVRLALIPETLRATNLSDLVPGRKVNIETDILGKYVHRYLSSMLSPEGNSAVNEDLLRRAGFL